MAIISVTKIALTPDETHHGICLDGVVAANLQKLIPPSFYVIPSEIKILTQLHFGKKDDDIKLEDPNLIS
ncbi:hypothetical protein G9A89_012549 [Geosiphon pyriformis]|nr:hypothetical protein G9A89_012549 [Geosiphon pyriformis]